MLKNNVFVKNVSWMVIGKVVQMALTLITTFFIARYLGPTEYGQIAYTFTYVAFFVQVCSLGTNETLVKELLDRKDNTDKVVGTSIFLRFIASLLSIVLIFILSNIMYSNRILIILAVLQSISLIFQSFESITYYYQSILNANKIAFISICAYLVTSIFRIVCLITKKDVRYFAFAVSLDYIVIAVILIAVYLNEGHSLKLSLYLGKTILNNSKHYLFANMMVAIYSQADKLLLGKLINETAVGYYSAATQLCNAWPFILIAIIDSARPIIIKLYNTDKNKYYKRIKQLYSSIFYISFFVALFFTLFSNIIIKLIYGTDYLEASIPLKIASWSTIFAYFGVSRTIWMQCENKLKYEKIIALFGAIINVLLNYILIKIFEVNGAALALTLTQFLTNFVLVYLIKDTRTNAKLMIDAIILKEVFNNEKRRTL